MKKINKSFTITDISNAWKILQKATNIVLLAHYKPDGDAISSCAALDEILRSYKKKVTTVYPTEAEFTVKHKPQNILINKHEEIPDVIVSLDSSTYDRIYYPNEFKSIPLINIDHHISNELNGKYNFVNTSTSSTCEVLYNLLNTWCPDRISKRIAECLLFGILTDTNRFLWPSTTASTLQTAASLMNKDVNLSKLYEEAFPPRSPEILRFWGILFSIMKQTRSGKAIWISITKKLLYKEGLSYSAIAGINNFIASFIKTDVVVILSQTPEGPTKMSFRSRKTDVNKLAHHFGGGGHKNAAGALINKSIITIEKELKGILEKI